MKKSPIDEEDPSRYPDKDSTTNIKKPEGFLKPEGLGREERVRKKIDFIRIFSARSATVCEGLKLCYRKNNLPWNRIAVTTVKGFKGAVKRNRQKRISREIYREMKHALKTGFDMIFILRPGEYSYQERKKQFQFLLKKAHMILDD